MNISFLYRQSEVFQDNIIRPFAICDGDDKNYTILCEYISEIDFEFSKNIVQSIDENKFLLDFSSESWGCEFIDNHIKIYFLYDEDNPDYISSISLGNFKFIMNAWMDFLTKEDGNEMKIFLND